GGARDPIGSGGGGAAWQARGGREARNRSVGEKGASPPLALSCSTRRTLPRANRSSVSQAAPSGSSRPRVASAAAAAARNGSPASVPRSSRRQRERMVGRSWLGSAEINKNRLRCGGPPGDFRSAVGGFRVSSAGGV